MMMGGWGNVPYGGMMNGGFWWMGMVMMLIQILFWVGIIVLAIRFFKNMSFSSHGTKFSEDNAITILKDRYAKGEIDTEEFNQRKKELLTR